MYVSVFSEFTGLDILSKYCTVDIGRSIIDKTPSQELILLAKTNIKIFFDRLNNDDRDQAYSLMLLLQQNSIATFVTDQLYSTVKDSNGNIKTIQLPKDRIIMKLL